MEPTTPLVWCGGYPAHYMADFHRRIEQNWPGSHFLYAGFGGGLQAFAHEQAHLPQGFTLLPARGGWRAVWRHLDRLNPAVVIIPGNFPRTNLVAALWAKRRGRGLFYLSDCNPLDRSSLERGRLGRKIHRTLLGWADRLLYIGSRNRDYYVSLLGKQAAVARCHWMPLPHNGALWSAAVDAGHSRPFTFLYLGRLEAVKGVAQIVQAFALLPPDLAARCRLVIAGQGSQSQALAHLAQQLGLGAQVDFLGAVPSDRAPALMAGCDALVMASDEEPWGLVVNEALSAGKPVIGPFWIGAFADLIRPGLGGLSLDDNRPETLCGAMQHLARDPAAARALGAAGQALVADQGWTIEGSLRQLAGALAPFLTR